MKKKLLSILLIIALFTLTFSMASCGLPSFIKMKGAEHSFAFSGTYVSSAYDEMRSSLKFLYEDTTLHLYDDGTWTIDMDDPSILIDNTLDKGSFTVDENGVYSFEGFEYGLEATGEMKDDGFNIYFKDPTGTSANAFVFYFKNS